MIKKKILLIGGSGFVGSSLIPKLKNFNISNIDLKESKVYDKTQIIDIRNFELLNKHINDDIDTVILLAAEHKDNIKPYKLYYDVNVEGTKNVLNIMDKKKINNLIFTSTVAVYGFSDNSPNEKSIINPFNHYGKSKYKAEILIKDWFNSNPKKKSATIIRPTVIFGIKNRGNVYNLFNQIQSGKFIMIGNGLNKKSIAYIENVTDFIKSRLFSSENFEIFNYSDKPDLTMNELVSIVSNTLGIKIINFKLPYTFGLLVGYLFDFLSYMTNLKFPLSSIRIKKFCSNTQFNSKKSMSTFKPKHDIKKSIEKTILFEFKGKNKIYVK